MTTNEKISLLDSYFDFPNLSAEQFVFLRRFTFDRSSAVRCSVPDHLLNFKNDESKSLLFRLSEDRDPLVRTKAYDTLGSLAFYDAESRLRVAATDESDNLARSYAVEAWSNVVISHNCVSQDKISFAENRLAEESDERCRLCLCYALYRFGVEAYQEKVLSFLNSGDYHIRCSALNFLDEVLNDQNKATIKNAVENLLKTETNIPVRHYAEKLMNKVTDGKRFPLNENSAPLFKE